MMENSMPQFQRICKIAILAFVGLMLTGCGPTPKDKLVGDWRGKLKVDREKVDAKTAGNPIAKAIVGKVLEAAEDGLMEIELKEDNTYEMEVTLGLTKKTTGVWSVLSANGDQINVQVAENDGESNTMTLTMIDDDTFSIPANGEAGEYAKFICRREKK